MSFVREMTLGKKTKLSEADKKKASELLEKARKEDEKIVNGVFKNLEVPGAELTFSYRDYKEHPIRTFTLEDGKSYDIPFGVAKHINRQCKYKRSKYLVDKEGKPILGADKPIQRYEFTPKDYL